jgi:hypothetical protein
MRRVVDRDTGPERLPFRRGRQDQLAVSAVVEPDFDRSAPICRGFPGASVARAAGSPWLDETPREKTSKSSRRRLWMRTSRSSLSRSSDGSRIMEKGPLSLKPKARTQVLICET